MLWTAAHPSHICTGFVLPDDPIPRWLGAHVERVLTARDDPEQLRTIFRISEVPMVLVDRERRYLNANEAAVAALGVSREGLLRMRVDDVTPPYLMAELDDAWAKLLDTGMMMGRGSEPGRTFVALSYFMVADVLPGAHVISFAPPGEVALDVLDGDGHHPERRATLTRRELEVLELAADGLNAPAIAGSLTVSTATVRTHFSHIYDKLQVSERAGAVAKAMRLGLIR